MRVFVIAGKGKYRELVYQWSDGTTTDIVYNMASWKLKSNRQNIYSQFITYGEEAAKELADYYVVAQKNFEQMVNSRLAERR